MSGKQMILVVDDEQPIRDLLADALEDDGYRVVRADDGWPALHLAVERRPDLIITDIMMPGLDGRSFVERARARGVTAPVILMSAVFSPVDLLNSVFFMKPFDLDELLATVESLLAVGRQTAPTARPVASLSLRERLMPSHPLLPRAGAMARAR